MTSHNRANKRFAYAHRQDRRTSECSSKSCARCTNQPRAILNIKGGRRKGSRRTPPPTIIIIVALGALESTASDASLAQQPDSVVATAIADLSQCTPLLSSSTFTMALLDLPTPQTYVSETSSAVAGNVRYCHNMRCQAEIALVCYSEPLTSDGPARLAGG